MIQRFLFGILLLALSGRSLAPLHAAEEAPQASVASQDKAAKPSQIAPGPLDGQVAFLTARLLEQMHFLHKPFDESVSRKFFDRYLEALDPQHMHFLQADIAEFEPYRTNLNHLTKPRGQQAANTEPAFEIYRRFLERLQQRVTYAEDLLKNEKFTFDSDDRVAVNRHEMPYPKDLPEAKALWRDRLRFEYLQEKLGKIEARKKALTVKKPSPATSPETKPKTEPEEIVETLSHRYHRTLRTFTDWDNEDVLQTYLTTLAHVYDPHSDYFNHAQLESFSISMNLKLFGIGAELVSEDGYCKIRRLLPGGPAIKSKQIKENDRIIAVAQSGQPFVDVVDMNLTKAVQLIRGPKGTEVRLKMIAAGESSSAPTEITLTRDEIKLEDQAAKAKIIELPSTGGGDNLRLGVIDLPSFYAEFDLGGKRSIELANKSEKGGTGSAPKSTTVDVAKLLEKLKQENVSGVILDLRRNGGGSLEEAIKLTGLFIKEGPVVQVKNFDNKVEQNDDPDPSVAYAGPLIVLTSKFSASASEILAGALQDYGRALIVGDASTHGKGTVQSVNLLSNWMRDIGTNDPGALKLTIKKFYRASGASTQNKGVVPDIVLPSVFNDSKDFGESSLENPLVWDTIDSAQFDRLNLVAPYLPDLLTRSTKRVAGEREFDYVRQDIEQYKKLQADKSVSLNEKERLKEKAEIDARQKARDKERLARKEPPDKIYELSLKQCDLPGLPEPVQKTNSTRAKLALAPDSPDRGAGPTNIAASASAELPSGASTDSDLDEEKPSAPDATLAEAEHILVDYLTVLPKGDILASGQKFDKLPDLNRKD